MDPIRYSSQPARSHESNRPLRLLFVTARYLPYLGGTEIHTYEVARRMASRGYQVTVLSSDPSRRLPREDVDEGVRVLRAPAWPAEQDYYFAPDIYRIVAQGRWDLIHVQGYHTFVAPLAMLGALRAGIPYVVTFHSGGHSSRLRSALRPLQQWLLRPLLIRADRLIGVSRFEVRHFTERLQLPPERFTLIQNGAYLPTANRPPVAPREGTLIISVGRLERYKGHHRVIAALPTILATRPDVRLRIVGAGPYEPALRQLAAELGVADKVEIQAIPGSERGAMASLLSGAELVILLSDYESQGMAVMEAISLGRPVLVADTSALRDLAEGGLVRATPLGSNPDEVAGAVLTQLEQPLIPPAINLPTWDGCAEQLHWLYNETVADRSEWTLYASS